MSANLLDPRLHRRAGAGHLAELVSDGVIVASPDGAMVAARGILVTDVAATQDVRFHDDLLGAPGGGVPVDPSGVYTAWAVVAGASAPDFYFGIDVADADQLHSGNYSHVRLDPGGTLISSTFRPRDIFDATPAGVGLDMGRVSGTVPYEVLDVGLIEGRAVATSVRHRRRVRVAA